MTCRIHPCFSAAALLAACAGSAFAQVSHRVVALRGAPAPGAPGAFLEIFSNPVINSAGDVGFSSTLTGAVTSDNDNGAWAETAGSLGLVARKGDVAPGMNGALFGTFTLAGNIPVMGRTGPVVLRTTLTGATPTTNTAIWSDGSGVRELLVRAGDIAPGTSVTFGNLISGVPQAVYNGSGQAAFLGFLIGTGVSSVNDMGIWSGGVGTLGLVARENDPVFGMPGVSFEFLFHGPVMNADGQVAFGGYIKGTGVTTASNSAIWKGNAASLTLVAREDSVAPGTGGAQFADFNHTFLFPVINNDGRTAFVGTLKGAGVTATNDTGIWKEGPAGLELVARSGAPAPGTTAVFSTFNDNLFVPIINGQGKTAFRARLTGAGVTAANDSGIWSEGALSPALVAREGAVAPGTGNALFVDLAVTSAAPIMNGAGQTAFFSTLSGPGVNFTNNAGIWATDPDGDVVLVARLGDPFQVGPGDIRTIGLLDLQVKRTGGQDGLPSSFNDAGELTFIVGFTDGVRAVAVATIGAACYPDCNGDGQLNLGDFGCFQTNFAVGNLSADCNGDGLLNLGDFGCFLTKFAIGCP